MNPNNTVEQAISKFYLENDFGDDGGVNEKYAWIKFGFFSIPIPNAESRRNNVYLHDISHIVTENNTTWQGESAVSAWEIASGGWGNLYIPWILTLWAMGVGVIFYPKNTLKSFKKGLTMNNAFTCGLTKRELFNLSVSDLRLLLSDKSKRNTNPYLWMGISFFVFLMPFIFGLMAIWAFLVAFCL
jgi:hypothetical protein